MAELRAFGSESSRGSIYLHSLVDLGAHGFEELELVIAGEATGVPVPGVATSTRPYATRLLVRRPLDRTRFNGCVIVEWLNVTVGSDVEILWCATRELLMRDGYGWVGLTAQPHGVDAMQRWDGRRYGELTHPAMPAGELPPFVWGETFSDAILTQVGEVLRGGAAATLFGRAPDALLVHGQSQSSMRLTTYLRDTQPEAGAYDGFLLHAGGGTAISGRPPLPDSPAVPVAPQAAKVVKLNSEAEVEAYRPARQDDSDNFVYWEVAGTGHTPVAYLHDTLARADHAGFQRDTFEWEHSLGPRTVEYALRAAAHHLRSWVVDGTRPPTAALVDVDGAGRIERDADGNALGGLRLPHVEAPVGRYLATNDAGHRLHPGFVPFDPARLQQVHGNQSTYTTRLRAATTSAMAAGHLLPADGPLVVDELSAFDIATATAPWTA